MTQRDELRRLCRNAAFEPTRGPAWNGGAEAGIQYGAATHSDEHMWRPEAGDARSRLLEWPLQQRRI